MQITVISEGLLLNSKYIKMGCEEGGFQAFLTQPPLVIVYCLLFIVYCVVCQKLNKSNKI